MANPQPTDSHLRIAHSINEEIMMRDFSKRQRSILDLILRLSWGCGKKVAIIPQMIMFELVGIYKNDIKKELQWLENARVITWDKEGKIFSFNKDYDTWKVSIVSGFDKDRFKKLLQINLVSETLTEVSKTLTNELVKYQPENKGVSETLTNQLVKHQLPETANPDENSVSSVPIESIIERTNTIVINNNNTARACARIEETPEVIEDFMDFGGNVRLTLSELDSLGELIKNAVIENRLRCELSKKKTAGYQPVGSDFDELVKMFKEGSNENNPI